MLAEALPVLSCLKCAFSPKLPWKNVIFRKNSLEKMYLQTAGFAGR